MILLADGLAVPLDVGLRTVGGPALATGLVAALALRGPLRRFGARPVWAGLAVACGVLVGHGLNAGWPGWPPASSLERLAVAPLVGFAAGVLAGWRRLPGLVRVLVRVAALAGMGVLLLAPIARGEGWGALAWAERLVGLAGVGAVLWLTVDAALESDAPRAGLALLLAAGGVLAVVLALSGSARLGQLAGAVSAALGALFVVGLARRDPKPARFGAPLSGAALVTLLALAAYGHAYADAAPTPLLLWGLALGTAWIVPAWIARGGRERGAAVVVLCAWLPAAGLAVATALPPSAAGLSGTPAASADGPPADQPDIYAPYDD